MELSLIELEEKLLEMREKGATDDTAITFDGRNGETDFERDLYPTIYYVFSDYNAGFIVLDLS